jgi:long-chain fatty acid transport protein
VFAAKLSDRIYFAVSLNAPFGFSSSYADTSVLRYHGTSSKVVSASLTPIVGVAITENLSVAAGPRIQYMDVFLDGYADAAGIAAALTIPGFFPGTDDVFYELDADDIALGYVAGFQAQVAENVTIGASYNSKIEHDFNGDADFDIASSLAGQTLNALGLFEDTGLTSHVTAPASIQFGGAIQVTPNVKLMASGVWTQWSKFEEVVIAFDNPLQPQEVITQNWKDTWSGSVGAEFTLSQSTTARFGVMLEESPVVDEFASPRIPDADRVWLAAGFSHKLSVRSTLHVGGSYVFIGDRPIDQPGTLPENLFRGSAMTEVTPDSVVLSIGMDFKF